MSVNPTAVRRVGTSCGGFAMAALLVGLAVMSVVLSMALPVWRTTVQREREAELIFRGEQYARAVALYQRSRGAFPPSVDALVDEKFLRKKYLDPMTSDGEFQVIYVGQPVPGQDTPPDTEPGSAGPGTAARGARPTPGGPAGAQRPVGLPGGRATGPGAGLGAGAGPVLGVVSKSEAESLREYNGRTKYSEWAFVAVQASQQGGATPAPGPGGRGGQTVPGPPGRGGRGPQAPRGFGPGAGAGRAGGTFGR